MLSIKSIGTDQKRQLYYDSQIAQGLDDYYSGTVEAPDEFIGTAAPALGLEGVVGREELLALFAARTQDGRTADLLGGQSTMAFTVSEAFIEVLTRTLYAAGMALGMVGTEVHRCRQSLVWVVLDLRFAHAGNGATFT